MPKQTVNHNGYKAQVTQADEYEGKYDVLVGDQKIGQFVFSDGHDGLAGYSNSCGIDCYQHTFVGDECVWGASTLYTSKRSATKGLIDEAAKKGLLDG